MSDPTISLGRSGQLRIFLPSPIEGKGHHIDIPLTLDGLKILRQVLQERGRERPKIGEPGSPTQEQVKEFLEAQRTMRAIENKERAKQIIPGLNIESLNL